MPRIQLMMAMDVCLKLKPFRKLEQDVYLTRLKAAYHGLNQSGPHGMDGLAPYKADILQA
jgi:hypothetical protein